MRKYLEAKIKGIDAEKGTFEIVASTGKVDRYGDTIDPKGWFLKNYKENPVILWSHSTGGFASPAVPPVAKAEKVWIEGDKKLKIKGIFAETPFAQELKTLVAGGFLNAVSVGFLPLIESTKGEIDFNGKRFRRVTEEEITKGIYDSPYGEKFTSQELLEVSWVSVPALPEALLTAKNMNLTLVTKAISEEIEISKSICERLAKEKKIDPEPEPEPEPQLDPESQLIKDKTEIIKDFILEAEKAISVLKEIIPNTDATPAENSNKGRTAEDKIKSQASQEGSDREAEIKLLKLADKAIESILIKLRKR